MFNFSPLQGALSQSPATQSLLELDGGVKVLVGLGWDETFEVDKLRELEKYVSLLPPPFRPNSFVPAAKGPPSDRCKARLFR